MLRLFGLLGCETWVMSAMWLIIIIAVPRTGSIQFFAGRPKCEEGGVEARAPVSEAGPKSSGGKAGTKKKNRFLSQQQPWCGRRVPRPVRRGRRPWVTMPASLLRLLVPDSLARPTKHSVLILFFYTALTVTFSY